MMKSEYRACPSLELRQDPGQPLKIRGYAAVFNQLSEPIMFFRERIMPGAFAKSLSGDVRAFNGHVRSQPIGRTKNGTLSLREDEHGLFVEIIPPNNSVGHDVVESIKRGDIDQMSFGFSIADAKGERWLRENGEEVRELLEVQLLEVSPVALPAYTNTTVGVRSLWPDGVPEAIENFRASQATTTAVIIPPPQPAIPSAARRLVDELTKKFGPV